MLVAEKVNSALEQLRPTQEKVDIAVKTAVEVAQPSRVFLFGSWARGESRWDSDLDLAVVMPETDGAKLGAIRRNLRRRLDEVPMTIDLVLTTEDVMNRFSGAINSIYHHIVSEGKVAYERQPAHTGADSPHQSR